MLKIYQYKNIVVETIQRNKRRINAYARQNQIRRIKIYIMLTLILALSINPIFAIENSDIYYGNYQVYCYKDPNMYIKYSGRSQPNYEYYYTKDNQEYPVYCLNLGLKGAEELEGGYTVDGSNKITDEKLQLILLNCYPYKSIEDLGLNNKDEAKFASQFAIWCYMENLNINLIEPITNSNENMVTAIKNIYNSKDNNINDKTIDLNFNIGNQFLEKINNKVYFSRIFTLANKNINNIDVTTNDNNVILQKNNEEYKISIPVDNVNNNESVNIKLNVNINAKENIVLVGKTTLAGFQDVALTLKDTFNTTIPKDISFKKYESTIILNKKDKDTKENLKDVKYLVTDDKDNFIGEYITDINGEICIKYCNTDNINLRIKEIETNQDYKIDEKNYEINIEPNDLKKLQFYNEKKKGTIEIVKKTKEYNEYTKLPENSPLKDVCFDIYDENNNIVDTLKTDQYGYAKTKKLPIGKYYIKETITNEYYQIKTDKIEVEILEDDENVNVQILNDNVYIEKKLPITGK